MRYFSPFLGRSVRRQPAARTNLRRPFASDLALEPLEERRLLAVIVWQNRGSEGSDTDQFTAVYGSDAALARSIVDRAIDDWETVIDNFNYLNFGGLFEPIADNTYAVTIDAAAQGDATSPGSTTLTGIDAQGKPYAASIQIDDDGGGLGWFFGDSPQNDYEFTTLIGPYRAGSASSAADFYRAIAHELGHAMGIAPNGALAINNFLVDPSIADPNDGGADLLSFFGATVQTTLTTSGGLHIFEGPDPGGLATPVQPNDLMNFHRAIGPGERELISDVDANLLADAYGYTVNPPSKINTFHANVTPAGVLEIRGLPDDAEDNVVIDNGGSLRVIVNGTEEIIIAPVTSISIQTFGGDDYIYVAPDVGFPVSIDAGTGNDNIIGGTGPTIVASVADDGDDKIDLSLNRVGFTFTAHGGDRVIGSQFNDQFVIELDGAIASAGMSFDGRAGSDEIVLRQISGGTRTRTSVRVGSNPGKGEIQIEDGGVLQTLTFENVEPIVDNIPAALFEITSVPGLASLLQGANEIQYEPGSLLPNGGRVTVDAFEPIEFENKANVLIESGAGSDNITLDNANLPTGLETITVDAGSADDTVTLIGVPDASSTTFQSVTLIGGAGADLLDASGVTVDTPITLNGGIGNDTLIGGFGADHYNGGDGDDTLVESRGDDIMSGDDGTDTILIQGTALADVITVSQSSLNALDVNFNGDADANMVRAAEIVRIESGDGKDTIGVSVSDSLIVPGPPDTDIGSLAFRVIGGAPNSGDRLVVRDDGPGDLVIHRQGVDGHSGSISVGPLQPVDYEGIEFVDITPLDTATGRTGDDGNGQLIVFQPDTKESNASRLVATPLGPLPTFVTNLSIDPGATELPDPFGFVGGDEDWFELTPSKTSTYQFNVLFDQIPTLPNGRQGLPGDGDLQIEVYDSSGTLVASSNDAGNNESLLIGMLAGEKYYLRVLGSEGGINVYDLNVTETDTLGPQVFDPDGAGPLGGVHITDDPGTVRNEAEFDLFNGKDPTDGTTPTPLVHSLTINLRDPLSSTVLERPPGFTYPALDAVAAMQPGNYRLVGDHVGVIPIARVLVTNNPVMAGEVATATVELIFFSPLPDDRYTLTVLDSVVDPVGNKLDGESNAAEPQSPNLPSGNGYSGGNFTARFTVDSRPEIGVYIGKTVVVDINGNGTYDPNNADATNRDLVFDFGEINDQRLAGKLSPTLLPGFDVLIAYGRPNAGSPYRWLIDTNGNGRLDAGETFAAPQIDGVAVAGDFNPAHDGDELAIFDGTQWHILYDGVGGAVTTVATSMRGYPIAGDFDGDGNEDLGTFQNNQFFLDYGPAFGSADLTINFGMPGTADRPVAADMDGDGIDDLGIWVPDAGAGQGTGEWRFLMSSDPAGLNHAYSPAPLGHDIAFKFGDPRALPIVGNFDPPVSFAGNPTAAAQKVTELYQNILGRAPDAAGMAMYSAQLQSGVTPEQVAEALASSPEHYGQIVDAFYADYLNRAADAGGRSHWVDKLVHGLTEDEVAASLLNSVEYSKKYSSDAAFIDGLYLDILQRTADAGGRATFLAALAAGKPRMNVIESLIESPERAKLVGRADTLPDGPTVTPTTATAISQAEAVVTALYHDILNRAPDAGGLSLFAGQIESGASRGSVALALMSSREYYGLVVDRAYTQYLHRAADAGGRQYWIGQLESGATEDTVARGLILSAEYSQLHVGNQAFVTALYQDILNRAPDAAGLNSYLTALNAGQSRSDVVGFLLGSREHARLLVQSAYTQILGRAADTGGLNHFTERLATGQLNPRTLVAALVDSGEYLIKSLG